MEKGPILGSQLFGVFVCVMPVSWKLSNPLCRAESILKVCRAWLGSVGLRCCVVFHKSLSLSEQPRHVWWQSDVVGCSCELWFLLGSQTSGNLGEAVKSLLNPETIIHLPNNIFMSVLHWVPG